MSPKQRKNYIKVKTILKVHWKEFKIINFPGRVLTDILENLID